MMPLISATEVQFCHETWQSDAVIQKIDSSDEFTYVICNRTPFHPVSHIWPDHPADKGVLLHANTTYPVVNCLVGAIELESQKLYVDKAIPVKRDTEGWVFVVVHSIAGEIDNVSLGNTVTLQVDKAYQDRLSLGHSAGHIAFLALNKVLHYHYWRKDADRRDPLEHYDFNSYAQETSFVTPDTCTDTYRLGKTLRKRGLNSAELLENLEEVAESVNSQVAEWLAEGSAITMRCEGDRLTDSRYWSILLDEKSVEIPCGGTHVKHTNEFKNIQIQLTVKDKQTIEMHTQVLGG